MINLSLPDFSGYRFGMTLSQKRNSKSKFVDSGRKNRLFPVLPVSPAELSILVEAQECLSEPFMFVLVADPFIAGRSQSSRSCQLVYRQGSHRRILPVQVNLSEFLTFTAYSEATFPKLKEFHAMKT